jgi:hypothetical protein
MHQIFSENSSSNERHVALGDVVSMRIQRWNAGPDDIE